MLFAKRTVCASVRCETRDLYPVLFDDLRHPEAAGSDFSDAMIREFGSHFTMIEILSLDWTLYLKPIEQLNFL